MGLVNELVRARSRADYDPPVTFIDIDDEDTYSVFDCEHGHVHASLRVPGYPHADLMFKDPEDAYWFADALLRAYDKAIEKSNLPGHKSRIRRRR